jgi:superfamily II DNA or RNA helicase
MVTAEQVDLFAALFRGRPDAFARYWEKNGRSGYSPAYSFDWNEFMAHKRAGGSIQTFQHKALIPFDKDIIRKHLNGQLLAGIYPILPDGTSYFLAADFDGEHWFEESSAYVNAAAEAGLAGYLEKSKSGAGGHVWIFFDEPYSCHKSRRIGLELVRRVRHVSPFEKEVSFDRLFPNQDSISKDGFGNLIALPLQGNFASEGTMVFIDAHSGRPFDDQWSYLAQCKKHTVTELDTALEVLEGVEQTSNTVRGGEHLLITVSNKIEIDRSQLTPSAIRFLKDNLNFLSTEYLTRKRLGKSVHGIQKYYKLIDEVGDSIFLPRGFLTRLLESLDAEQTSYEVTHEHPSLEPQKFASSIRLTSQQDEIVGQVLQHKQGVIVAPPGSGKTMMGMELIARRQLPALVLVHRKELLEQWVEHIQTFLNIPKIKIGRYSGIKKKIGESITVGLLQSFARAASKTDFKDTFGTVVIDECHHIPAITFREVIQNLNPLYIYGLTATPKRKHNDEKLIYAYTGDIVATMTQAENRAESTGKTKMPGIVIHETPLEIPFEWKTDRFQLLSKIVSFDTARNRMIANDIIAQVEKGERVLVLSERKEHLDILQLCLKGRCESILITGESTSAQRFAKLKRIKKGNYQVILSTGQFFGEGMDVNNISVLVLAFPFSFEGKLIQYIGRLLHGSDPKLVIDYRDPKVGFLERQYKQRQRYYNKLKTAP